MKYGKANHLELKDKYTFVYHANCTPEVTKQCIELYLNRKQIPDDIVVIDDRNNSGKIIVERLVDDPYFTKEIREEYIALLQVDHLGAIRRMLRFFVILTCVSILCGLIVAIV